MLITDNQIITLLSLENIPPAYQSECVAIVRQRLDRKQSTLDEAIVFVVKWVRLIDTSL